MPFIRVDCSVTKANMWEIDMPRYAICFLSLCLSSAPAMSDADFIKGVYLSSEELCAQARKDGLQGVIEAGNVILTSRGLESIEYNCEFLEVTKATRSPAWAVTAICQEPGYLFPDVLSIVEMNETQYDLVSVRPASGEDGDAGNSGSYFACAGVEAP